MKRRKGKGKWRKRRRAERKMFRTTGMRRNKSSGFSGTESCTSFKLTRIWGTGQCGKESKRKTVGT